MWRPLHKCPSFATPRKRQRAEEPEVQSAFLNKPVTEKLNCENVTINGCEIGHASMQGYRVNMEDEHIIEGFELKDHTLVAIMDGHAGKFAAEYTGAALKSAIEKTPQWIQYAKLNAKARTDRLDLISQALVEAYIQIDKDLLQLEEGGLMDESGCTCVSAVITPTHVICANVGDSRCLAGSMATAATTSMTEDHKPSNPDEKVRIENGGGFVMGDRVNGELAMSRALGDFRYKRNPDLKITEYPVICIPDVSTHKRSGKKDEILVLACDGVFDVMKNAEVIEYLTQIVFVEENSTENKKPTQNEKNASKKAKNGEMKEEEKKTGTSAQEAAESLIDLALAEGSTDNISAVVLKFL